MTGNVPADLHSVSHTLITPLANSSVRELARLAPRVPRRGKRAREGGNIDRFQLINDSMVGTAGRKSKP